MELCTTKQAADNLGVTPRSVLMWSQSGVLKSWKIPGGHRRFSAEEVSKLAVEFEEKSKLSQKTEKEKGKLKILVVENDAYLPNLYNLNINSWCVITSDNNPDTGLILNYTLIFYVICMYIARDFLGTVIIIIIAKMG